MGKERVHCILKVKGVFWTKEVDLFLPFTYEDFIARPTDAHSMESKMLWTHSGGMSA